MTYSRVSWKDGSGNAGGDTPVDALLLNQMDAGIAANDTAVSGKAAKAGDTFTGEVDFSTTLSGANKVLMKFIATDGKTYGIVLRAGDNGLGVFNYTDSVWVFILFPTHGPMAPAGATTYVQPSLPGSANKWDVCIKTPFS